MGELTTLSEDTVTGATTPSSGAPSGLDVYSKAEYDAVPIELRNDALVELHHCIFASAAGAAPALVNDATHADTLTSTVSGSENVVVSVEGSVTAGTLSMDDPRLGALVDNGGLTWTFALPSSQTAVPTSNVGCDDLDGAPRC